MKLIKLERGFDAKVHFTVFKSVMERTPVDLTEYRDIVFEVYNSFDQSPILRKTMGNNGVSFRLGSKEKNQITVHISAEDTMRFGANSVHSPASRLYSLSGVKGGGVTHLLNGGFFYSEPNKGGPNV